MTCAAADGATGWSAPVDSYDRWFDRPWGRYAFAVESAAVRRAAGPLTGAAVLDAGCGTGRFAATLAAGPRMRVGADTDPAMLALAEPRVDHRVLADVTALPFASGAFDLTVAVTVLEFVDDPGAAVAELARVTRPGGRVVIGALNPRSPWGLANRRRLRSGEWCDARFLQRATLRGLAAPHGSVELHAALYAPDAVPGLGLLGPVLERLGRVAPGWGAFQVVALRTGAAG